MIAGTDVSLIRFPQAPVTRASGINNSGEIVGTAALPDSYAVGYLLSRGVFSRLNFPGASSTTPTKINDAGTIVGSYQDPNGNLHGFEWDENGYLAIDVPGSLYTQVLGINNQGQLVGVYGTAVRNRGFLGQCDTTAGAESSDADLSHVPRQ